MANSNTTDLNDGIEKRYEDRVGRVMMDTGMVYENFMGATGKLDGPQYAPAKSKLVVWICDSCGTSHNVDGMAGALNCQNCGAPLKNPEHKIKTPFPLRPGSAVTEWKMATLNTPTLEKAIDNAFRGADYQPKKWWEFWRWFE